MENSMVVPQKIKNRATIWPSNPSSGYLPKKLDNIYSQRYKHPYVHCSIIHDGQDMETTKVSFNRGLNKEDVVHIYYGIVLSHKKRWNTATCDDLDESWEYHANEISHSEKAKNYMTLLIWDIKLKLRQTTVWWLPEKWVGEPNIWWRRMVWLWVVGVYRPGVIVMYAWNLHDLWPC